MAARKYPHLTVPIKDLVPPFVNGDWVTASTEYGLRYLPDTGPYVRLRIVQITEAAVYVGKDKCQSGWQLFGLDSDHFRKVSRRDILAERDRLTNLVQQIQKEDAKLFELFEQMAKNGRT